MIIIGCPDINAQQLAEFKRLNAFSSFDVRKVRAFCLGHVDDIKLTTKQHWVAPDGDGRKVPLDGWD